MAIKHSEELVTSINASTEETPLEKLVIETRSYRRYKQEPRADEAFLLKLVNLARKTASASNHQRLRYHVVSDPDECQLVHDEIGSWAGALKEWSGPTPDECPTGYIILLASTKASVSSYVDAGVAAQTMALAARESGFAYCMFMSAKKTLREKLGLPEDLEVKLVMSFGAPGEKIVLEEAPDEEHLGYYRDDEDTHHVPKFSLKDVLV